MFTPKTTNLSLAYRSAERCRELFEPFATEAWACWLTSGGNGNAGRYDIIVARPFKTIEGYADYCRVTKDGKSQRINATCLSVLAEEWQAIYSGNHQSVLPFNGGMLGYFSYDLGQQTEGLQFKPARIDTPFMMTGFYDWAIICDHHTKSCQLHAFGLSASTDLQEIYKQLKQHGLADNLDKDVDETSTLTNSPSPEPWQNLMSPAQYQEGFDRIQQHLRRGDTYQVNFTQAFQLPFEDDPWMAFKYLNSVNQAPHSAFMRFTDHAVLSLSPERFISVRNGQVSTQPIKGTRPRHGDPKEDRALAAELLASEKDRAENLMIVDLMRNDLGKICMPGSVKVPQLFQLQSFASVHHLVSTVTGELPSPENVIDLLAATFPAGSITGAPKHSSMSIIDKLETCNRSVYCGSIAYIDQFGNMDSSVTIRTLLHQQGTLYAWAGGGIVTDSIATSEYQECYDKLARILPVLAALPEERYL